MHNMVGCKAGSCYLVEKRQKCLEVMAVNNSDICIFSQRFGST
jgi:hypothetical protein